VYTIPPVAVAQYHFEGTPASLLVSAKGLTVKYWPGAYVPTMMASLENALSIKLPGLSAHVKQE
jgi:hypothetical protein